MPVENRSKIDEFNINGGEFERTTYNIPEGELWYFEGVTQGMQSSGNHSLTVEVYGPGGNILTNVDADAEPGYTAEVAIGMYLSGGFSFEVETQNLETTDADYARHAVARRVL